MTDSEDDNQDDRSGLTGVTSEADVDVSDSDDARLGRVVVHGRILPCRGCSRIRTVDETGHCPECAVTEQQLVANP